MLFWQVCYARILDMKRKFLEAALRYYEISQIEKRQIGDKYGSHFVMMFVLGVLKVILCCCQHQVFHLPS